MDSLEMLLNMMPDRTSKSNIRTPVKIAKEMIELLPDDVWNSKTKFLDPACKSGIFLYEAYKKLMNAPSVVKEFPNVKDRKEHILKNQLYGIAMDQFSRLITLRVLYGKLIESDNIICISGYTDKIKSQSIEEYKRTLNKEFKQEMKFDVVIGNPPYNKGMDLDFVDKGYGLSSKYTCMITPAKWQTTADDYSGCTSKNIDYKEFREKYVPHMSHVCFYPDALDIFHISQVDGITYFLMDKEIHKTAHVKNVSFHQKYYNGENDRDIKGKQTLINIGQEIVDYLGDYEHFSIEGNIKVYKHKVITNSQIVLCGAGSEARKSPDAVGKLSNMFNNDGQSTFIGTPRICEVVPDGAYGCAFSSDDKAECESFVSWLNTKFTRFFVAINISKLTGILTDDYFRFVPAPPSGKFDHIYTDEELYKAFNLPQKYIDVIESVIKERK